MSRLSPIVFAEHGQEFLDAARREFDLATLGISMPAYFLVSRSIELALKSFLLLRGHTESQLRRLSHDLDRALAEAKALGLDRVAKLGPKSEAAIQVVNVYYFAKDLEYPTTGYKSYPQAKYLLECGDLILKGLQPHLRSWRPEA